MVKRKDFNANTAYFHLITNRFKKITGTPCRKIAEIRVCK